MRLTRRTLLDIIRRAPNPQAAIDNPTEFATAAVSIIKQLLADQLIDGIQYHKINDWYALELFTPELESWEEHIEPAAHALYDQVIVDSEVERTFVKGLEQRDDVKLYIKLPDWFKVPTPIGNYNPDWAIVMESEEGEQVKRPLLYLISETKGTTDTAKLQYTHEGQKIKCGRAHFQQALNVHYQVMTTTADLPNPASLINKDKL